MGASPGGAALVGRDRELAVLIAACRTGPGGLTLVEGEAGSGKTRLLDEVAAGVDRADVRVLRGRAVPTAGAYRPLAEALAGAAVPALAESERIAPFRAVLALILPAWPAGPDAGAHLVDLVVVLGEALVELLGALAGDGRLVVVLDDLHWADRDTLAALEYLAGRLARSALDGDLDETVREHVVAAADGLPLLVEELCAGLVESGSLLRPARTRGCWRCPRTSRSAGARSPTRCAGRTRPSRPPDRTVRWTRCARRWRPRGGAAAVPIRGVARTLLAYGEAGATRAHEETSRALAGMLPNAELVGLPGVGHGMPLEDPAAVARLVMDTISRWGREQ